MYDLTEQEQKEVDAIAVLVAERMRQLTALKSKTSTLAEAFIILQELGEHEVSNELLRASKRCGDKLKNTN